MLLKHLHLTGTVPRQESESCRSTSLVLKLHQMNQSSWSWSEHQSTDTTLAQNLRDLRLNSGRTFDMIDQNIFISGLSLVSLTQIMCL